MSQLLRQLMVGGCSLAVAATGAVTVASAAPSRGDVSQDAVSILTPRAVPTRSPARTPSQRPHVTLLAAARRAPVRRPAPQDPYASFGFDISRPQCRGSAAGLPPTLGPVAIVGITNGRPFSTNPCLGAEWGWARSRASAAGYLNLAAPRSGDAFAYGAASARDALARARSEGAVLHSVWLDVEIGNYWSAGADANTQVILGAIKALLSEGVSAGVYSTPLDWRQITHGAALSVPVWMAVRDGRRIADGCASTGFGGRAPDLIQAVFLAPDRHEVDGDLICTRRADFLRMLR